ncbi:hypothetical protein [Aquimarina sp. 2201CG5-10]|uniref:hypothetical protein n=1 Tax=Aquimarina callyspongiae TaxID=3098150 RepID=UPI002AB4EE61|nr:hypothetical protein [Aquimarina sp. 2201CG5-10]MDY8136720.1 hypothetical protein [Aquimarina sp. 2201CG5-10]
MLKDILNLGKTLNKTEQKQIKGGFDGVPIAGFCGSLQGCINSCTRPGTICHPCADNNAAPNTWECRVNGPS